MAVLGPDGAMIEPGVVNIEVNAAQVLAVASRLMDFQIGGLLKDGLPADAVVDMLMEYVTNILGHIEPMTTRNRLIEQNISVLREKASAKAAARLRRSSIVPANSIFPGR